MLMEKRANVLKSVAGSLVFPVIYVGLILILEYGYQLIWNKPFTSVKLLINIIVFVLFFAIILIVFRVRKQSFLQRVRWNAPPKHVYWLVILLYVGVTVVSLAIGHLIPASWSANDTIDAATNDQNILLILLVVGILGPIAEETAFRGLMMTHLLSRVAPWLAVTITAIAFAVTHGMDSLGHIFGAVPFAICICLMFYWTKSIRVTIMLHILNNVVVSLLEAAAPSSGSGSAYAGSPWEAVIVGVVGLAVTVLALVLIYRRSKKNQLQPSAAEPVAAAQISGDQACEINPKEDAHA